MKKTTSRTPMTMMEMYMWTVYMCMTCAASFSDMSSISLNPCAA